MCYCYTRLRVIKVHMRDKFKANKGDHFLLSWLWNMYDVVVQQSMYEAVIWVYMLHLVVCTILADKSRVGCTCGCLITLPFQLVIEVC